MSEHDEAGTPFGKYELLERIGSGGMAEVHRARVTGAHGFEKIVVVKKILPEYASNPAFVKMLVAEAKISSMLHHPNIVQTYEFDEAEGQYYIAMEHVDGVDWLEVLTRSYERGARPPTEVVVFVMSEVLKGLAHAHAATDASGRTLNLVHRDVSPSNILVSLAGEAKLMDFGVARSNLESTSPTNRASSGRTLVSGKLAYQSPELVARQVIDHRSDLFAVGVVLFESLTLTRLFAGDTELEVLSQIRDVDVDRELAAHPYIPVPIQEILRRALARHPTDRYESASAFQAALLDYLFEMQVRVSQVDLAQVLAELFERPDSASTASDTEPVASGTQGPDTRPTRGQSPDAERPSTRPMRPEAVESSGPGVSIAVTPVLGLPGGGSTASARERDEPESAEPELAYEGALQALGVTHFLYRLAVRRATGRLVLTSPEINKEVSFRAGCPVQVKSSAPEELFGELLIARALVDRETMERAVGKAQEESRPLGEVLVSDGIIPPHRLLRLLEEQFRTRFLQLFRWQEGTYAFYTGEPEDSDTSWMGTDPFELIAEGVRSELPVELIREVYAPQQDLLLVHRENEHITHNNLRLSSRELKCYGLLADSRTLREALAGCEDEKISALYQITFLLEQTELLSLEQGPT